MSFTKKDLQAKRQLEKQNRSNFEAQPIEASRGNKLKDILIDVAENDDGEMTIIAYLSPKTTQRQLKGTIQPAFIGACKECFGEKQDTSRFDLVYRDQDTARRELGGEIPVVADGKEGAFDTLELHIAAKEAVYHEVDSLKRMFLRALNNHL